MKKFLPDGCRARRADRGPAMRGRSAGQGAGLPRRPPPVVFYNWTGCYVGGHVGGLWVKKDWTSTATGIR